MSSPNLPGHKRPPNFAERVVNTMASVQNPTRVGLFVRVVRRPRGRMNFGTWWELTDGMGNFWQVKPENCVPYFDESGTP